MGLRLSPFSSERLTKKFSPNTFIRRTDINKSEVRVMHNQDSVFTMMKKWSLAATLFTFVCLPMEGFTAESLPNPTVNFTGAAKKATPAVVSIQVKTNPQNRTSQYFNERETENEDPFNFFNDDFFQQFFSRERKNQNPYQIGQGSGFIVSSDGYILTNGHVVQGADEISVILNDGREFEGKIVGIDPNTDIAVVKIDGTNLPYLPLGNSDELEVGQWVMAVGNPLGLQASVTAGVVSAKGRNDLNLTRVEDFIQTDASINRGNSGGPLLNLNGDVVGMNTAIVTNLATGGYMGIGFAIPSNLAQHVMKELIETGSVARGFMGVVLQQISRDLAQAFNLKNTEGALIAEVSKGSPAESAGLKQGDIILQYNSKKVTNIASLRNAIALITPGSKVTLGVVRNGENMNIPLTVGSYPKEKPHAPIKEDKLGIEVEALTAEKAEHPEYKDLSGVLVSSVTPGTPAAWAGIKKGSLIVAVNHTEIKSPEEFHQRVTETGPGKPILLLIKQGNYMHFVSLKVG